MTDSLRRNASLVEMLGGALRDGGHALGAVPSLLKQVLVDDGWQEFVTQRGEHVLHERFADFITAAPLKGLGATVDLVRRVVADDDEAVKLLRVALKEKPGPKRSRHNITASSRGDSRSYALERLERDAPALHADVLSGNLSAHAAMVRAGFRPRTFTVRADDPASVVRTLRRNVPAELLAEVRRLLDE